MAAMMLGSVLFTGLTAFAVETAPELDLRNQGLTDANLAERLQAYDNLNEIELLKIGNNPGITNISALFTYMPNITSLYASSCGIAAFPQTCLSNKLTFLNLNGNQLTGVSNLSACFPSIGTLYVKNNQITSLNALTGLSELEALYADNNQIASLKGFPFFPLLNYLTLSNNRIADIRWSTYYRGRVDGKQTLETLDLSHNRIYEASPLSYFGAIATCLLSDNYILDIGSLPQCTYDDLDLSDNYITDFSVLDNIGILNSIKLGGNYISGPDNDKYKTKYGTNYTDQNVENRAPINDDWFINTTDGILMRYFGTATDIQIPDNRGITTVGLSAFAGNQELESVKVPDAVTQIMESAFSECIHMKRADLGAGVSQIEGLAFYLCTRLAGISIPEDVYTLERNVFRFCTNLKSVCFTDDDVSINTEAFYGCTQKDRDELNNVESQEQLRNIVFYAPHTMDEISGLKTCIDLKQYKYSTDYNVVSGVLTNCYYAGTNASSTDVQKTDNCNEGTLKVPDGVTAIDTGSTYTAPSGLKGIAVPEGVETIDFPLQMTGTAAVEVLLPDTLSSVDSFISGTLSVTVFCKPGNQTAQNYVTSKNAQNFTATTKYEISYNTVEKYTGTDAVVNIPATFGLDEIGTGAFYSGNETNVNNTATSITVPEGVEMISATAFRNCRKITEISLPDSLKTISTSALSNCLELESADIPDKVTIIAANTFNTDRSMSEVSLPENLKSVGNGAFQNCAALTKMNAAAQEINIPTSVTELGVSAFEGCTALNKVTLPATISTISASAFKGCTALTKMNSTQDIINIPATVSTIGESAFEDCTALTQVILHAVQPIQEGDKTFWNIDVNAFKTCTNLNKVVYYSQNSGDVIKNSAFEECDETKLFFYGYDGSVIQNYCDTVLPFTSDNFKQLAPLTMLGGMTNQMSMCQTGVSQTSVYTQQNLQDMTDEIVLASLEQAEESGVTMDLKDLDARIHEAEAALYRE